MCEVFDKGDINFEVFPCLARNDGIICNIINGCVVLLARGVASFTSPYWIGPHYQNSWSCTLHSWCKTFNLFFHFSFFSFIICRILQVIYMMWYEVNVPILEIQFIERKLWANTLILLNAKRKKYINTIDYMM